MIASRIEGPRYDTHRPHEIPVTRLEAHTVPYSAATVHKMHALNPLLERLADRQLAPRLTGKYIRSKPGEHKLDQFEIHTAVDRSMVPLSSYFALSGRGLTPQIARQIASLADGLYNSGAFYSDFRPESIGVIPQKGYVVRNLAFLHENTGQFPPHLFVHQVARTFARLHLGEATTAGLIAHASTYPKPPEQQLRHTFNLLETLGMQHETIRGNGLHPHIREFMYRGLMEPESMVRDNQVVLEQGIPMKIAA